MKTAITATIPRQIAVFALLLLLNTTSLAQQSKPPLPQQFTLAAVGDMIYLRPVLNTLKKKAPSVLQALASGDVVFGNFETNGFDLANFSGHRQYSPIVGVSLLASPNAIQELHQMGFNLVSFANNHAFDWGVEGLHSTGDALHKANIVYAGVGDSLHDAQAAKSITYKNSSIGLVAATTAYPNVAIAADAEGPVRARPGLHPLPIREVIYANAEKFSQLQSLAGGISEGGITFMGKNYRLAEKQVEPFTTHYQMDTKAVQGILDAINASAATNSLTIFSLHTHEAEGDPAQPTRFERDLAHAAIDAGADIFIAHGPHQLRGIEIYKGKPIYYSLANFSVMSPPPELNPVPMVIEPGSVFTRRAFLESAVATNVYRHGKLMEIHLYPYELNQTNEVATNGIPQDVSKDVAQNILTRMQQMSRNFGTEVQIKGSAGVITIN